VKLKQVKQTDDDREVVSRTTEYRDAKHDAKRVGRITEERADTASPKQQLQKIHDAQHTLEKNKKKPLMNLMGRLERTRHRASKLTSTR